MHFHSTDYRKDRDRAGRLLNRGFWFYLPRPLAACRLFGHKPVIDGYDSIGNSPGARWVCCDRCGLRPEPQGCLDPAVWDIGTGVELGEFTGAIRQPGRSWPKRPEGVIGGQFIIGRGTGFGVSLKIGNAGSEHTLAAHLLIPVIGALYLHTERFGTWLQRRLNPVGYESKVIEASIFTGRLWWKLWMPRDGSARGWRDGSLQLDPRVALFGEKLYSYTDVTGTEPVTLALPDGTEHAITVRLRRQAYGRLHGRKRLSWTVSCQSREGIPSRPGKSGMTGWAVEVSDASVKADLWQQEAVTATAAKIVAERARYCWKPPAAVV
jgi:hypothetical protein